MKNNRRTRVNKLIDDYVELLEGNIDNFLPIELGCYLVTLSCQLIKDKSETLEEAVDVIKKAARSGINMSIHIDEQYK